jgi:hypothetical protein
LFAALEAAARVLRALQIGYRSKISSKSSKNYNQKYENPQKIQIVDQPFVLGSDNSRTERNPFTSQQNKRRKTSCGNKSCCHDSDSFRHHW